MPRSHTIVASRKEVVTAFAMVAAFYMDKPIPDNATPEMRGVIERGLDSAARATELGQSVNFELLTPATFGHALVTIVAWLLVLVTFILVVTG
jgi:hypothetical protein